MATTNDTLERRVAKLERDLLEISILHGRRKLQAGPQRKGDALKIKLCEKPNSKQVKGV